MSNIIITKIITEFGGLFKIFINEILNLCLNDREFPIILKLTKVISIYEQPGAVSSKYEKRISRLKHEQQI